MRRQSTIEDYIAHRIVKDGVSGCWEWIGPYAATGHPQIKFRAFSGLVRRFLKIPFDKRTVLAFCTCGNLKCVNPHHTEVAERRPVTTQPRRETPLGHRFSTEIKPAQAATALAQLKDGATQKDVAATIGVSQSTISRLTRRTPR